MVQLLQEEGPCEGNLLETARQITPSTHDVTATSKSRGNVGDSAVDIELHASTIS